MEEEREMTEAAVNYGKEALEWAQAIVVAIVLGLLIKTFVFYFVLVEGPSMQPTMETGDRLFVWRFMYTPQKGDIVVFKPTYNGARPYIKRVIATEGQTVDINFETSEVFVDGVVQDEPFINEPTKRRGNVVFPVTVDKNCVFVMGDNRNDSEDSRAERIGMVDRSTIMGKAIFRWWPFNKFGSIH